MGSGHTAWRHRFGRQHSCLACASACRRLYARAGEFARYCRLDGEGVGRCAARLCGGTGGGAARRFVVRLTVESSVRARERATLAQVSRGLGARGCGLPGRGRFETGLYAGPGHECPENRLGTGAAFADYLWSGRASAWVRVVDLTVMAVRRSGTGSGRVVRGVKVRLSVSSRAGSARSWT